MKTLFKTLIIVTGFTISSCNTTEKKEDSHEGHDHSEGTHVHDDGTVHEGDHHQEEFEAGDDTLAH
jgi:hypothetical protein